MLGLLDLCFDLVGQLYRNSTHHASSTGYAHGLFVCDHALVVTFQTQVWKVTCVVHARVTFQTHPSMRMQRPKYVDQPSRFYFRLSHATHPRHVYRERDILIVSPGNAISETTTQVGPRRGPGAPSFTTEMRARNF